MIIDMMSRKRVNQVPYLTEYRRYMSRMSSDEIAAIKSALNEMIDGDEIHTTSWMPGADWSESPFQAIYEKAARHSVEGAAKCFGLMVWEVFMERPETWTSEHFEKDGEPIKGRTYFRIND
jgi:hypothetical protein